MHDYNHDITINDLLDKFRVYNNNPDDIDLINRAYDYAYNLMNKLYKLSTSDSKLISPK